MAKRNPAMFFTVTWLPYVVASVAISGWLLRIDIEAMLFALAAATSLAGLLTLVHEVEYPAIVANETEPLAQPATA